MQRQVAAELDYLEKIVPNAPASVAFINMMFDLGLLAQIHMSVNIIGQQILTVVTNHVLPAHRQSVFFASSSLSRMRALCSWLLEVPTVTFNIFAISSCSYPSMS